MRQTALHVQTGDGEYATGPRRDLARRGIETDRGAGDKQRGKVGAAETATGGARHGQHHDALYGPIRSIACDTAAVPVHAPYMIIGVDGQAIRITRVEVELGK